jgi:amidase
MSELWQWSAGEIASAVRGKKLSAREAVEASLARMADVNPRITAVVVETAEEARSAARALDDALAKGEPQGALAGVPVVIKINVDQAGRATSNGLRLQKDLIAKVDSPVVANLKKAGAIVVGRTNTPAFSLRWFTRNSLFGHTRNPRDPARTPGGSSGGTAAAVAAGIVPLGHATDIAGSIRYPAYACGLHGLRPSLGRIPAMNFTSPDRHIGGQLMATSGPIARSIADVKLAFTAMSAEDLRDPWYIPAPLEGPPAPKRAALCVSPEGLKVAPEVETALRDAAKRLQAAGWTVEDKPCPPLRRAVALQLMFWLAEFRRGGADVFEREGDPDALFVYGELAKLCPPPTLETLMDGLQERAALTRAWQLFLKDNPILLLPVSAELPFPDQLDVQSSAAFARVWEAQLTQIGTPLMGLPGLTVTTGSVGTVPVGVQLVAGRWREDLLLEAGAAIEAAGPPIAASDPSG